MFQPRRDFGRTVIVSAVALAMCALMLVTSAIAQEAPRDTGSLIKPPTIKPPTARSQTTNARTSASSRRRRRRARRTRASIASRRAAAARAAATRPAKGMIVDSADGMPHTAPSASTTTTLPRSVRPVSGGVLNGRALILPPPIYPPVAKAANAAGTVTVRVLIDENGKIAEAKAIYGPKLLRKAAEDAAREARFAPTQLSGQPVPVTGVITYTFVVPQ
jgi:TonB family protein